MRLSYGLLATVWLTSAAGASAIASRRNNDTDYTPGTPPIKTPWTDTVGVNPWPEYPRPRLQRSLWKNLNGVWRYRNAAKGDLDSPPFGQRLENAVLVPFCLESALSGKFACNLLDKLWLTLLRCHGEESYLLILPNILQHTLGLANCESSAAEFRCCRLRSHRLCQWSSSRLSPRRIFRVLD